MRTSIPTALAIVFLTAGCGSGAGEGARPSSPEGSWQLVSGRGPEGPLRLLDGAPVTLVVEDGEIGGTAACNSYGGSARIDGQRLEVDELAQTEMGCEPEVMELEAAYMAALLRADRIRRTGETLVLTGPSVELTFEPVPPVPAQELVGTTWHLDTLLDGDVASTPAADATLRLHEDGRLEGHTGCRAFRGSYVVRGGEVRATQLTTDDPPEPCAEDVVAQDDLVVSAVGDGFRPEIEGDRLTISEGDRSLVFRAATP